MANRGWRAVGAVSLALVGTLALSGAPVVTTPLPAGAKTLVAEAQLLDTESWIMGASGLPIPPPEYLTALTDRFITPATPFFPGQLTFPDVTRANPLFTPQGLYPLTGVKSLPLDTSLAQGVSILDTTITEQINAGNKLVVLGYSQSATINSLEMRNLMALPEDQRPGADELSWVMLGNPSNPNGGLLERFNVPVGGQSPSIPSLGITFSGATPADTPWNTASYTQEYDGFADFPRYPINLLSDINALMGIMFVHGTYQDLTDEQLASAIELAVSDDYAGNTHYYMIPTEILPILQPLLWIPVLGQPLYDLLEPTMRILVNLGYGSIEYGWDQGPADLPTTFGVLPDIDLGDLLTALSASTSAGIDAFLDGITHLSLPSGADLAADSTAFALPSLTDTVNTFSSALATAYGTLLPTADIVTALLTTAPAYAAGLFAQELAAGDLFNAIGMPLSALVGLSTMAAGFELMVLQGAISSIAADFQDLFAA